MAQDIIIDPNEHDEEEYRNKKDKFSYADEIGDYDYDWMNTTPSSGKHSRYDDEFYD